MADVLSQSQIDALLKSMQDGPPKEEKAEPEVAEVSAQETKKEEVPPAKKIIIVSTISTVQESLPKRRFVY